MEERVTSIVRKCMDWQDVDIRPDTDLWAAGITSMQVVRVMVAVEDEFGIEFPETALARATFATVASIAQAVRDTQNRMAV